MAAAAYGKSDRADVCLGGLHQEVHPEVHQFLLGGRLLHARLIEMLVDQNGLHQGVQIPETSQRESKRKMHQLGSEKRSEHK